LIGGDDDCHAFDDDDALNGHDAARAAPVDPDAVTLGAAADIALRNARERPRRRHRTPPRRQHQLCTNLPSATAWARTRDAEAGLTLSAKLDRPRPAAALQPAGLRSALVADAAFRCSPFRRVTRVLITAFEAVAGDLQEQRTRFNKFVDLWGFAATEKRGVLPLRATRICQQTSG